MGRQPSSAFRGVWLLSLSSGKEVYESWIWYGQKKHSVGRFDSEEAAAKAYDVLAAEHHGSKAGGPQLNFGADGSRNPYKQSGGGSAAEGTIKERAKRKIQGLYGENGANILANQPGGSEPVQRLPKFKPQRRAGAAKAVSGVSRLMVRAVSWLFLPLASAFAFCCGCGWLARLLSYSPAIAPPRHAPARTAAAAAPPPPPAA